VCIAGTRLLLEESIADEFLARLKAAQHWQPGNPLDPDTTMGMLIDNTHADNVHSFIRGGESQSTLFLDGRKNPWPAAVGPTIFVDVDPASTLSREEIFGPVLVVTASKAKKRRCGLPTTATTASAPRYGPAISRAHRMSRRLKAGSVFVNNYNDGDMTVPFGGYKQSGNGRDKSLHALEKFTELKTIWIALES
jgi:gamma-glutamyl-gamma-aminobutyraldehyde dehydrogenase